MGETSNIEWTHATFNPWRGCVKVSEGCKNCYAEHLVVKRQGLPVWGQGAARRIAAETTWRQPERWNRQAEAAGERRRVFCASLADIFEDYSGPDAEALFWARQRLFKLIAATPWLDWLLLTKRPENVMRMVPVTWYQRAVPAPPSTEEHGSPYVSEWAPEMWPSNVWLGFTAENQERFDERWEHAKKIPAPVIFTSVEPQIGPVVLPDDHLARGPRVWVITGGESGSGARPYNPAWADRLVSQCGAAGVPVFVKQMGSNPTLRGGSGWGPIRDCKGGDWSEWSAQLRVRQFPAAKR